MATAHPSISIRVLLSSHILCLLLFSKTFAYEEGEERQETTESIQPHSYVIKLSSLLPEPVCSTSTPTSKGFNAKALMKVVHKHGPCSQNGHKQMVEPLTPIEILQQDQSRVAFIQSRLTNTPKQVDTLGSKVTLPANIGSSFGIANYIVKVGFGTPERDFSLFFDTGSILTWIQCQPCLGSCYTQKEPIFDPSLSSSYSNISCNSKECLALESATSVSPACLDSTCIYGIAYGDNSTTAGYLARETLTLSQSDVISNFLFGCGESNQGLFGLSAGLLGLGQDKLSIVFQTAKRYGGIFSYCLPSTSSSTGYLAFGYEGKISNSVKFTPLVKSNNGRKGFYFLDLTGISVAGHKLSISASVFRTPGTIIDSGTVVSRLPPAAYSTLRSSFRQFMSKYYPLTDGISILDTCYDLTRYDTGKIKVPPVALFFRGGVTIDIDPSGVIIVFRGSRVCLAFAANSDAGDVAVLGNRQQHKLEVIYDVVKGRIGFGPGGCS